MRRATRIAAALEALFACVAFTGPARATSQSSVFPGAEWQRIGDPTSAGYCQPGLDAATARAKQVATTAMTVVVGGRVMVSEGKHQLTNVPRILREAITPLWE